MRAGTPCVWTCSLSGNPYLCGLGSLPDCDSIMLPPPPSNLTQVALGASSSGSSGVPVGAIVGGVLGGIALLLVLVALILFWRRRQRVSFESPLSPRKGVFERECLLLGCLASGTFTGTPEQTPAIQMPDPLMLQQVAHAYRHNGN